MTKGLKKLLTLLLAGLLCFPIAACGGTRGPGGGGGGGFQQEEIDPDRYQLYVYNFNGGYGSDWLAAVKARYEELHKNDVYPGGKVGVQIYINPQKTSIESITNQILDNRDEIYFTEYAYYYTLKDAGVLRDITDAVTADLAAYGDPEGTTIESKMTGEQKAYYGITEDDGKVHYYGLPHYSGYSGLIYNVDMFEQNGYYFVKDPVLTGALDDYFIYNADDVRSAGPDGTYDTDDDGLPATYEEFFLLCQYIQGAGQTPVIWTGANNTDYLNNLLQALVADYEGLDQMMLNYNLGSGTVKTATDLGTIQNGQFVEDAADTEISAANVTELFRQAGKYYGLDFLETLIDNDKYHNDLAFNSGYSHMNAQEDFLYAGYDGETAPIAMLCDGIWWEAEATSTFIDMMNSIGTEFSKDNRNFALMPLPKANQAEVDEAAARVKAGGNAYTLFDHIYSLSFVKANISEEKLPYALDFIKFVNSNASLVEFTQITSTPKAFNYTMTEPEMAEMSPFARSVIALKQKSDIVYPYSGDSVYINNQANFGTHSMYYTTVNRQTYQWPSEALHEGAGGSGISAEDYFAGMKGYYDIAWASLTA